MERVEATFIKHFSNSNRSKGMSILRPHAKKERHRITFSLGKICTIIYIATLHNIFLNNLIYINGSNICFRDFVYWKKISGFFVGCTAALILAIILVVRTRHLLDEKYKIEKDKYMENMFPLYR